MTHHLIPKLLFSITFLLLFFSCEKVENTEKSENQEDHSAFDKARNLYLTQLDSCVFHVEKLKEITEKADIAYHFKHARKYFKQTEVILAYAESDSYKTLNEPNLLRVEEGDATDIKIRNAEGFQVLEELIFASETETLDLETLHKKATFVYNRLKFIQNNTDFSRFKSYHFLWMMRHEIIRVAFAGITGFDSPALQNSLKDANVIYGSMSEYLAFFETNFQDKKLYNTWLTNFKNTQDFLAQGDFETFNRYEFIQKYTHTQITLWNQTVADWNVEFPFDMAIKNDAPHLFSRQTFNIAYFSGDPKTNLDKDMIALGKQLFYDESLSESQSMSCGTCHQPELAFTDEKHKALGNKGQELLRNSPTLLYSAFQKGFFYDKRAGSLEGQVLGVVKNQDEFHTDLTTVIEVVKANDKYRKAFEKYYEKGVTGHHIQEAIALYIRSLAPFNSKFDRNIRQEETTLTPQEIEGFNLFMGKAACATCHFPPAFNGTVPPVFNETELEALGVPFDAKNNKLDTDLGRYNYLETENRKHFFKTMTVRNVEKTAPYMHNGAYDNLEQVMHFYNVGGGVGMGFDLPLQTLPPDSLNLTDAEQQAVIAFMKTLTDETNFAESDY